MASRELVVKEFGSVDSASKYAQGIYAAMSDIADFDGRQILRLTEDGDWIFGQDETPLDGKDVIAINPRGISHGWIAFDPKGNMLAETEDGEPAEVAVPITQPCYYEDLPELAVPKRGDAPQWRKQVIIEMAVVAGPHAGEQLVYKPTSQGGRRMAAKIAKEIARRIEDQNDECVPLIELWSTSYYNRRFKKEVSVPEMAIVEWRALDDDSLVTTGSAKGAKDEKPARKTARKAARDDDDDGEERRGRGRPAGRRKDDADGDDDDERDARANRRGGKARTEDAEDDAGADRRGATRSGRRGRDEETDDERPARGATRGRARDDVEDDDEDRGERRGRSARADDRGAGRGGRADRSGGADHRQQRARKADRDDDDGDDAEEGVRGRRAASGARSSRARVSRDEDRGRGARR